MGRGARSSRDVDDELLVCIAGQLRLVAEPLSPCLLRYASARAVGALVEGDDVVEVDVGVERELYRGGYVVGVVVLFTVVMMIVLVVAVRHYLEVWGAFRVEVERSTI